MKILVTGGCGYIGSHTIIDLLENRYDVVSIDNLSNSNQETIQRVYQITKKSFKNYVVDLCDINLLYQIFELEKPTHIIHFAAFKSVPESIQKPLEYYQNNLVSLINLLRLSQDFKIEKFIFSSSCSVYGNPDTLPVTENSPLLIAESPYASTKQMSERIIKDFSKNSDIGFTILRYFNPAGNHPSGLIGEDSENMTSLIPNIVNSYLNNQEFKVFGSDYDTKDGTAIRDLIHVCDVASAHTKSLSINQKFQILNLGSGSGYSILEVIQTFEKVTKQKLNWNFHPRREGDVVKIFSDNTKAKKELNWSLKFNLEDMITDFIKWKTKKIS